MVGYSKKTLSQKLGIKENHQLFSLNSPENLLEMLFPLPDNIDWNPNPSKESIDVAIAFAQTRETLLNILQKSKPLLKKSGMLWICWPKGKSRLISEINREDVRAGGVDSGLVDVKVAAIDENWSGLKFVYRTKDR